MITGWKFVRLYASPLVVSVLTLHCLATWQQQAAIGFCYSSHILYCFSFSPCMCHSTAWTHVEPILKHFLQMLQWVSKSFPATAFNQSENWLFSGHLLLDLHFPITSHPPQRIPYHCSSSVSVQISYHSDHQPIKNTFDHSNVNSVHTPQCKTSANYF